MEWKCSPHASFILFVCTCQVDFEKFVLGDLCHVGLARKAYIIISHEENEIRVKYIKCGTRKYINTLVPCCKLL